MEKKLSFYNAALDALLNLVELGYEDGNVRGTINHLRSQIASIHTDIEEVERSEQDDSI